MAILSQAVPPIWGDFQRLVFGDHLAAQERLVIALRSTPQTSPHHRLSNRLAARLASCCAAASVRCNEEGTDAIICEQRCNSRCCVRCGRLHALRLMYRATRALVRCAEPRFLTLTLRSTNRPLRQQLKHLTKSFASLRRSQVWQRYVTGGMYVLEVTYNEQADRWHPHLHAIIDGDYFPQPLLRAAWKKASGGSEIVHIAASRKPEKLARYLAKYVAKGDEPSEWPLARTAEYLRSFYGLRTSQTFGTLHGISLSEEKSPPSPYTKHLAYLDQLAQRAADLERPFERIIGHLIKRTAEFYRAWARDLPAEPSRDHTALVQSIRRCLLPVIFEAPSPLDPQQPFRWYTVHAPPIYDPH